MKEIKLDISQKADFKEAWKNFKEDYKEYNRVLNRLGFTEYSLNIKDMMNRWTEAMFEHIYNETPFLQVRSKAYSDFEEFKQTVIHEQSLSRNDELSSHFNHHIDMLNQLKIFIPDYSPEEEYLIKFYTFEGCELQQLLLKLVDSFPIYKRITEIISEPMQRYDKWNFSSLKAYINYHPDYPVLDKEPYVNQKLSANPNKEGMYKILDEETIEIRTLKQ